MVIPATINAHTVMEQGAKRMWDAERKMTMRDLDENIKNSDIEYCISEYVRPYSHREMLRKHWFEQSTIGDLAAEYHLSETAIKKIIYGIGDKVLLKASKM